MPTSVDTLNSAAMERVPAEKILEVKAEVRVVKPSIAAVRILCVPC